MNAHAITSSSSHGSTGSYAVRLGLSFLLIIALFGPVMSGIVPRALSLPAIVVLCVGQLLVQFVWFLHPGTRKERRENIVNFVCTGSMIAIMVAGYYR
jgi:cytochrome o ubiquinol oxidase operon protein cyoD